MMSPRMFALQRSRGYSTPETRTTCRTHHHRSASTEPGLFNPGDWARAQLSRLRHAASTEPGLFNPGDLAGTLSEPEATRLQRSRGYSTPETYLPTAVLPSMAWLQRSRGYSTPETARSFGGLLAGLFWVDARGWHSVGVWVRTVRPSRSLVVPKLQGVRARERSQAIADRLGARVHQIAGSSALGSGLRVPMNSTHWRPRPVGGPRSKMPTLSSRIFIAERRSALRSSSSTRVRSHTNTEYWSGSP